MSRRSRAQARPLDSHWYIFLEAGAPALAKLVLMDQHVFVIGPVLSLSTLTIESP
jgi:hypothetical protein